MYGNILCFLFEIVYCRVHIPHNPTPLLETGNLAKLLLPFVNSLNSRQFYSCQFLNLVADPDNNDQLYGLLKLVCFAGNKKI